MGGGGLSVAMETRVFIQSAQKLMQPFPYPSDATYKNDQK